MTSLSKCPFCGSEARLFTREVREYSALVECTNEDCEADIQADTDEQAIARWNTRAMSGPAAETGLREALRDVAKILQVPAAEYVPAIVDAWKRIDAALAGGEESKP